MLGAALHSILGLEQRGWSCTVGGAFGEAASLVLVEGVHGISPQLLSP